MISRIWSKFSSPSLQEKEEDQEPFLRSDEAHDEARPASRKRSCGWTTAVVVFQWLVIAVGLLVIAVLWPNSPSRVYSPAQSSIRYHDVVYASGFKKEITKYQGPPSPEVDRAWFELYPLTMSRISAGEASKLVNKTQRIPDDPENYIVSIDVFHQLHCLNVIRKKVWGVVPDTYVEAKMLEMEHVDHCIDSVRQSLMCAGDVTALPWKWTKNETDGSDILNPEAHVIHTCRDFDAIVRWAQDRKIEQFTRGKKIVE